MVLNFSLVLVSMILCGPPHTYFGLDHKYVSQLNLKTGLQVYFPTGLRTPTSATI